MSKLPPLDLPVGPGGLPLEELRDTAARQLGKLRAHAVIYDDCAALEALDELDTDLQYASNEQELGRICESLDNLAIRLFQ